MLAVLSAELNLDGVDVKMISTGAKDRIALIAIASRQGLWIAKCDSEFQDAVEPSYSRCPLKDSAGRWLDLNCVGWSERQASFIAASSQRTIRIWDCDQARTRRDCCD